MTWLTTASDFADSSEFPLPCEKCLPARTRCTVNTVDFDVLTEAGLSAAIQRACRCGRAHSIHFLAAHPTVVARKDPWFRKILNSADLVVADGAYIAGIIRLKRGDGRRITAVEGFERICKDNIQSDLRHFVLGGATAHVADALILALERRFGGIAIVGCIVPPHRAYDDDELADVVAKIRAARADVVWIGLGAPKQDILAYRLRAAGAAPAIVCVGAAFDFVAGVKRRAPRIVRRLGLEWAYRLFQEPRRLWRRYLLGNLAFIAGIALDLVPSRAKRL